MHDYHIELNILIWQLLASFVAGLFGAIAGGGGFITLPAILLSGIPPHMALGTNKMLAMFTTLPSASVFIKKGLFTPKLWYPAILAACLGTIIGVSMLQFISSERLSKLLPLLLILAALYVCFPRLDGSDASDGLEKSNNAKLNFKPTLFSSVTSSGLLGFYSGFLGAGIGVFWTSAMMALYQLDILEASGVARVMCFITNLTAFILFMIYGHVSYLLGFLMGLTMACGSFIGANMAIKFGGKIIKPIIVVVVIVMSGYMAWNEWF